MLKYLMDGFALNEALDEVLSDELYYAWNLVHGAYTTPISRKLSTQIQKTVEKSQLILELTPHTQYKRSLFQHVDLIVLYETQLLNSIPASFTGQVIVHSLSKIPSYILQRKGLKTLESFEYETVRKYRDIGLFIYHLEADPWYLKSSEITKYNLTPLFENFQRDQYIMIATYQISLLLETNKSKHENRKG